MWEPGAHWQRIKLLYITNYILDPTKLRIISRGVLCEICPEDQKHSRMLLGREAGTPTPGGLAILY